ncbi:mitochondrial import inner membrane translocase subunit Tim10-like isoform X2 [Dreissena polymorpha]|uniref:mitochondrial import inner membrane translocase subunit Tim10-like isoform X2 n=1 Tax=Dreissena polymorpha TaxID=45954 RepID=UPI0022642212|nr:mitochondrial import inner membrane translocase subunit Tim10-like isoform X2 [Dreissena polymorpha]
MTFKKHIVGLNATCTAKCLQPVYGSTELVKDEAVCIDRCVAKYLDLHEIIGKRLQEDKDAYRLLAEKPYLKSEGSAT